MNNFLETLKIQWDKLTLPMKVGGSVLVLGVFTLLLFLSLFSSQDYAPLYTDLTTNDAAAVVSSLQDNNIPYRLGDNGATVLVPSSQIHELRLTLASQGLPTGGVVGFEIFNTTRLGETEADRQLRYLWALQGELTRTIRELQEVQDARVHIVLPQRSLFVQESRPSTASVLLQLQPGARLMSNQVNGIAHLVATSVEGLLPENVTIVDNRGTVLNQFAGDLALDGEAIARRMELERAYERQLEDSVTAMLERIYGYGQVVARVRAEMNFDLTEEYHELFEPVGRDQGIARSEQSLSESFSGTGAIPGGSPGVDSNIPGYVGTVAGGESEYERQESIINYEVNRIERRQSTTPGQINRLSVSVWVNGELTPAQLTTLQESVSRAVGLQAERGDQVFVDSMDFAVDLQPISPMVPEPQPYVPWWVYLVVIGAVAAVALVFVRRRRTPQTVGETIDYTAGDEEEPADTLSPEDERRLALRQQISKLAQDKPQDFAQVVKTWLADE